MPCMAVTPKGNLVSGLMASSGLGLHDRTVVLVDCREKRHLIGEQLSR